jgi:SAM-dependent methyltransferase
VVTGAATERDSPAQACAWCGAPFDGRDVRLGGRVECRRCGVATTDPWPSDETLERAYGGSYRPPRGRFAGPGDALLRRSRGALARRLDRLAPPGPVLDVGAGAGWLVEALRRRGRRAVGLEREPGDHPDIRHGDLRDVGGRWSAIVFWHSLEHLRDPSAALERAAALLSPGGVLVLAMPNADSLQARAFRDRWLALDPPRHLVHVPARALLERLRHLGLRVERVSYWRGGQAVFGWLHGLVALLPGRLDLYDALRRREARSRPMPVPLLAATLLAGGLLFPLALLGAVAEGAIRRGGTVYVEARLV